MELTAGLVVADRFRLVRPLGQGGMGAVWLAQHTGLDVPCAVKFIHEEAARSPEIRARFEREAKAAAQLRSPHVVTILDHGVWQGAPYIAMELLEGEDLGQRLQRLGRLPPPETLAITTQVGRALTKAHGAGLVHRDLKPSNIFLVHDDDREIAKVLDFGIAKVKETGLDGSTKTGSLLGTPFYMSPEQARGAKSIDHRADLWALAVVVYRCLVGQLPFVGEALGDLFVKIIVEPPPVPSQHGAVPPEFDTWWARATARDPAQRFQSAKEFTDALGLALGTTVQDGVEVGSRLARSSGSQALPATPAEGRTIPLTPSQPGQASPVRPITPQPSSSPAPASSHASAGAPVSGDTTPLLGPTPMPVPQSISVAASPPPRRGTLVAAAVLGVLTIGVLAVLFFLRTSTPSAQGVAAPLPTGAAPAPVSAVPSISAAPEPPASQGATPTASASASALPAATTAAAARATATAKVAAPLPTAAATAKVVAPPAGGKRKTDFGF